MTNIDSNELSATEMTNIDSKANELSDVELGAVSGGNYTFLPSAPSKETVQNISAVVGAVAGLVAGPVAVAANAVYAAGVNAGAADASHDK